MTKPGFLAVLNRTTIGIVAVGLTVLAVLISSFQEHQAEAGPHHSVRVEALEWPADGIRAPGEGDDVVCAVTGILIYHSRSGELLMKYRLGQPACVQRRPTYINGQLYQVLAWQNGGKDYIQSLDRDGRVRLYIQAPSI